MVSEYYALTIQQTSAARNKRGTYLTPKSRNSSRLSLETYRFAVSRNASPACPL